MAKHALLTKFNDTPHEVSSAEIAEAFARFVTRWPLSHFITITCRPDEVPKTTDEVWRRFRYFINRLNCDLYGCKWNNRDQGVLFVAAVEQHLTGEPHMHVLLGAPDVDLDEQKRAWWEGWLNEEFGRSDFQVARSAVDVARYIVKTIKTTNDVELSKTFATTPPSR